MEDNKLNEAAKGYAENKSTERFVCTQENIRKHAESDFKNGANWQKEQYPSLKWFKESELPEKETDKDFSADCLGTNGVDYFICYTNQNKWVVYDDNYSGFDVLEWQPIIRNAESVSSTLDELK